MCVRQALAHCRRLKCSHPLVLVAAIAVCLVYPSLTVFRLRASSVIPLGLKLSSWNKSTHVPLNGQESDRDPNCVSGPAALQTLIEIEPLKSKAFNNRKKTVVLRGYNSISSSDLRLYQQIFVQYGYELVLSPQVGGSSDKEGYKGTGAEHWDMMICFTSNEVDDDRCLQKGMFDQLLLHQKVNKIPGLENTLCRKDGFCQIMKTAQSLPVLQSLVVSPLCFDHYVDLEATSDKIKAGNSISHNGNTPFLKLQKPNNGIGMKQYDAFSENALWGEQRSVPIEGLSAILKVYVLVTSLSPLRAFIHSTGLVQGEPNKKFFVTKLLEYFEKYFGTTASAQAFENMKELITQLLLIAEVNIESSTGSQGTSERCCSCFQLLAFDLSFGTSVYPMIVEVHQQPVFEADDNIAFADRITKDFLLEDTFKLLLSGTSVVSEIHEALENIHQSARSKNNSWFQKRELCLSARDVTVISHFQMEFKSQGKFQLLYPSTNPDYQRTLYALYHNFDHTSRTRSILGMHQLLSELRDQFQALHLKSNLNYFKWEQFQTVPHTFVKIDNNKMGQNKPKNCSTAKHTLTYISRVLTSPQLKLNPIFTPKVKVYYSEVPFDVVIIKIRAEAANCHCQVHLDERKGFSIANYPLGLGNNRIHILVSDESRAKPAIVATYTINVYRHSRPSLPVLDGSIMCSFLQDCGLIIQPDRPCGLQPVSNGYLSAVVQRQIQTCKTGDAKGRWFVPCLSCSDNRTCDWQKARWQPDNCRHLSPTKIQLQQCMSGRKVLFIGDSTNRGMMYYLMEEMNETLQEWDKAHDSKFYYNLNRGKTFTSYVYYPQFWLSLDQRPTFEKALEQLIQRSHPLENNDQTVLVVGGVQWLNTRHLHIIQKVLQRQNLLNILVIIKSIGMGFHLPVDGIRSLSLKEVQNLWKENTEILSEAKDYGFDVVDTFSMTMGRYKEFLQGKCACHFHEVVRSEYSKSTIHKKMQHLAHFLTEKDKSSQNKHSALQDVLSAFKSHYHVKGPINQAYSEILLSRVCVNRLNILSTQQ
ncbi:cadherin-like and PC-esterase domain-containing protein 1 [Pristis pectinata]|uniref:cadherin-like and PC-esterase domain-containing protein 1 n=1 Tax=Pristis pectinata TaxID=685728 RepID=UPI00223D5F27|nr:cadherin-like and PC-esterase domain-containing protein 1 [Pristis pectinata]